MREIESQTHWVKIYCCQYSYSWNPSSSKICNIEILNFYKANDPVVITEPPFVFRTQVFTAVNVENVVDQFINVDFNEYNIDLLGDSWNYRPSNNVSSSA